MTDWIKCEDELPPERDLVLVLLVAEPRMPQTAWLRIDSGGPFFVCPAGAALKPRGMSDGSRIDEAVTHWRRLDQAFPMPRLPAVARVLLCGFGLVDR